MHDEDGQFGRKRRRFRAIRILEAAGTALSPASVTIATLAIMLMSASIQLIDRVLPPVMSQPETVIVVESSALIPAELRTLEPIARESLVAPWFSIVRPLGRVLGYSREKVPRVNSACRAIAALALWSLTGVILCRRSALIFAGNDDSTFGQSARYGFKRWAVCAGAPLIPLSAAALLGLILAVMGFVGRLPLLGSTWLLITSPVIAAIGFAIAFLFLATAIGWSLMTAAVSTDDCDSFGSLSRAYSGLTGRPWQVAGHFTLSAVVGIILMGVVVLVSELTIWCAMSCVSAGSGNERALDTLLDPLRTMLGAITSGIGASYFWSASTIVYLLLRQEVDGVPLDRVAPDDDARPVREPLPVVGIPATDASTEPHGNPKTGL